MPKHSNLQIRPFILSLGLFSAHPTLAQANSENTFLYWGAIALLSALLLILIIGRYNNLRARILLNKSQKQLEAEVLSRTHSLHITNQQLEQEIRRHKTTEALLKETQHYLHSMINSMPSVIIGVTHLGLVTHWNIAAENKTGVVSDKALGEHISNVYQSLAINYQDIIDSTIVSKVPYTSQNIQEGLKENLQYYDVTIYPLLETKVKGAVIRIDNVTLRVRVESMMIQNEKMLSLGELAAGIAHEINNPLSIVLHGIQNISRRLSDSLEGNLSTANQLGLDLAQVNQYMQARQIPQFLEEIKAAGERSAAIVNNMLNFSRNTGQPHQPFDLAHTIHYSLDLLAAEGKEMPKIEVEIDSKLPLVYGSATEIQQVILNLVRNSAQALNTRESSNSYITIHVTTETEFITIKIADNGSGMSPEVARHIFEPFYTTKEMGQGTGLGLSVSYFIITEHHNGTIEVQSTPGEGTCFYLKLPKQ